MSDKGASLLRLVIREPTFSCSRLNNNKKNSGIVLRTVLETEYDCTQKIFQNEQLVGQKDISFCSLPPFAQTDKLAFSHLYY